MDPDGLSLFLRDLFVPGTGLAEKILRPIAVYIFLVVILRVGGRRELAQMNAFDLVVLLTLANAVQNAIIGDDNSLLGGFIGATTLIILNLIVVRYLYRHPGLDRKLEGEAVTLVKDGRVLGENLRRELITEDELLAAIRRQGIGHIEECSEVILETSGTISAIQREPTPRELAVEEVMIRLDRIEALLANNQPWNPSAPDPAVAPSAASSLDTPPPDQQPA
jgi:uncharacterized membrane protein YcaP (DUF421 family)